MADAEIDALEQTEELFQFLRGNVPEGYQIKKTHVPKLTADQAWTVIWYLGNLYWQVPDYIERCDICGHLYDSESSGECLDYGKAPYHFCDTCIYTSEYDKKKKRDPNREDK